MYFSCFMTRGYTEWCWIESFCIYVRAQCVVSGQNCDASGTDNQTPSGHGNSICSLFRSPVCFIFFLPGLFDLSRSLGVLYSLQIKFSADHSSSRCRGELIWDQIRGQDQRVIPWHNQWGSQCQITPAISGSNEEDYLLINAPVIFVGNGRGKKRGWTNGKTVLDNYDMTLFQNMVEASKYFLWDLGAPPENVQSFFCIQKG